MSDQNRARGPRELCRHSYFAFEFCGCFTHVYLGSISRVIAGQCRDMKSMSASPG